MTETWANTYDWAGLLVRDLVYREFDRNAEVLDVGAGRGKYRLLLRAFPNVDAVEVWEPYVDEADLRRIYRRVYVADVGALVDAPEWNEVRYDLAIMGDVLEHLTRDEAQRVLRRVYDRCDDVIVVVPYLYAQDAEDGNDHQRHRQDDLTPELLASAYPELHLIAVETRDWRPFKGLYRRRVAPWPSSAGSDSDD